MKIKELNDVKKAMNDLKNGEFYAFKNMCRKIFLAGKTRKGDFFLIEKTGRKVEDQRLLCFMRTRYIIGGDSKPYQLAFLRAVETIWLNRISFARYYKIYTVSDFRGVRNITKFRFKQEEIFEILNAQ